MFTRLQKVVAVGEDAMRFISNLEHDSESNKLVEFFLPCYDKGFAMCDTHH